MPKIKAKAPHAPNPVATAGKLASQPARYADGDGGQRGGGDQDQDGDGG
jgi:hypothetical protein